MRRVCLNIAGSLLQKLKNYFTEDEFWPCGEYSRDTAKTFSPKLTPQQESQLRSISFHREKRNAYHEASETLSILYVV